MSEIPEKLALLGLQVCSIAIYYIRSDTNLYSLCMQLSADADQN